MKVEKKVEELKIVFCICGDKTIEWKLYQRVIMAVFIPQWFLSEFDRLSEDVRDGFSILGEEVDDGWGSPVKDPEPSFEWKWSCKDCPLAPRDQDYRYAYKYAVFKGWQTFEEFVRKVTEEVRKAWEFYKSLPTFNQRQIEIILETKIKIKPTKDRVEILAEELRKSP